MAAGTTGARADAIELLTSQHRDMEQVWAHAQAAHDRAEIDAAQHLVERLITLLSQHDAIEVQFLYPTLRGVGEDGARLAEHSLDEHQQVRDLLKEADGHDHREVWPTLQLCLAMVETHVQEEESLLFPKLRQECEEDLYLLGSAMEAVWKVAPTHPHPATPHSVIGATIVAPVVGVVDRIRDLLKKVS